jgi:hypothetical protein
MASVTLERIRVVETQMAAAVTDTSERSMLPRIEQARILSASCAKACDLLSDWLISRYWNNLRPSQGGSDPIADFVPSRELWEHFLGPTLRDAYVRAARECAMTVFLPRMWTTLGPL